MLSFTNFDHEYVPFDSCVLGAVCVLLQFGSCPAHELVALADLLRCFTGSLFYDLLKRAVSEGTFL